MGIWLWIMYAIVILSVITEHWFIMCLYMALWIYWWTVYMWPKMHG